MSKAGLTSPAFCYALSDETGNEHHTENEGESQLHPSQAAHLQRTRFLEEPGGAAQQHRMEGQQAHVGQQAVVEKDAMRKMYAALPPATPNHGSSVAGNRSAAEDAAQIAASFSH